MGGVAKAAQVQSAGDHNNPADESAPKLTDSLYDFPESVPLRKSYIIASTPRCGSTFLSTLLWQTGLLGAPSEYWNYHKRAAVKTIGTRMMERLEALSRADYLTKLLACRTSRNGIFGVKVHFHDFEEAIRRFPKLLDVVAPTTFIYIERLDRVAQAVSMARAVQTGVYAVRRQGQQDGPNRSSTAHLRYDKDLISHFITQLQEQNLGWRRWFEANKIDPFVVTYEKLAADQAAVARSVIDLLGVGNDVPQEVRCRVLNRQGDAINKEWITRYKSERLVAEEQRADTAAVTSLDRSSVHNQSGDSHIFDQFDRIKREVVESKSLKAGYLVGLRQRQRYKAIVAQNRELFHDARVLDVQCGDGRWSFAAIEAGASHVVGLESRRKPVEIAGNIFARYGIKPESYEFVNTTTLSGMADFVVGQFDLILCQEMSELSDPYFFFGQLCRLQPKHVILDTALNSRPRAVATFKLSFKAKGRDRPTADETRGKFVSITCIPNHELVGMLSEHFGFRWRVVDWQTLGITDWAGLGDYEQNQRQTYVLDRT